MERDARNRTTSPGSSVMHTGGGAAVGGNINTGGGDFVGRDQINIALTTDPAALQFLLDFIRTASSRLDAERSSLDRSSRLSRERAFALYRTLGEVDEKTDAFLEALSACAGQPGGGRPEEERARLMRAARTLMDALPQLASALDAVNPQLDIHAHELVQKIERYRRSRALLLTELEQRVSKVEPAGEATLGALLAAARENAARIKQALQEMRTFLKAEFPFKEGFG